MSLLLRLLAHLPSFGQIDLLVLIVCLFDKLHAHSDLCRNILLLLLLFSFLLQSLNDPPKPVVLLNMLVQVIPMLLGHIECLVEGLFDEIIFLIRRKDDFVLGVSLLVRLKRQVRALCHIPGESLDRSSIAVKQIARIFLQTDAQARINFRIITISVLQV